MQKGASGDLAEARRPRDDPADSIGSDFVAIEPEKFSGDGPARAAAWNAVDQGLNVVGKSFSAKETRNDADVFP